MRANKPPRKGYQGVLSYKDEGGVWREKRHVLKATTKTDAKLELARWREEMEEKAGTMGDPSLKGVGIAVADYVDGIVDELEASGQVEAATVRSYHGSARYIRFAFSEVKMGELTPEQVREWEQGMVADGYSSSTIIKTHNLLKQAMKRAVERDVIPKNPLNTVRPPKRKKKNPGINALDGNARARILGLLGQMEATRITVAAQIALYTGMREGEICGLKWSDLDLQNGQLWVRRSIALGEGGAYEKLPKTDRVRDVVYPQTLACILKEWRATQKEEFLGEGEPWTADEFVLGTPSAYLHPSVLSRSWATLARSFGVKGTAGRLPTFHDLRHTWATMFLAAGGDVKTAASNLGHAKASMTLDVYASCDPDAKRRAADIVERAMLPHGA
ncbi:tyrosine-type recombinase/integrase [Kribbibacterium absianum]|uniref:tyrosine-type recombinase/integrase n=1 Tax=Kribbibacterium absianum TaxID=3044210 RepID=UPI0024BD2CF4|nr:tyrosine-type recombinase/integrase [Olsenella sp. YH-ols2216]